MGGLAARRFHAREMLVLLSTRVLEHAPNLAPFSEEDIPLLAF